ncbi:MAG: hypothetical protein KGI38_12790 [Thaumarchaeota archaeon]|nr:hypothetical protein [Nitrososphaerota archaeon]
MAATRGLKLKSTVPHILSPQKRRDIVTWIISALVILVSVPALWFFIHKDYPSLNHGTGTVTVVTTGPTQSVAPAVVPSTPPVSVVTDPKTSTPAPAKTTPPAASSEMPAVVTTPTSSTGNANGPGPCLLFTAEVCQGAKAIVSPNGLAVAFHIPSGATLFAPTTGGFAWVYKDGSVTLSANTDNNLPFPETGFSGSNGSYYTLQLLGTWNFALAPPEQGNHTYKQGEALAVLTPADGYIVTSDGSLPANTYNFIIVGKSSAYMTPFLEK